MKILMLTPYLPYPPNSGGQVRSYNLIKNLAKEHQITLFSLIKEGGEKRYIKELKKYCKKVKVFYRSTKPWTLKNILKTAFSFYPFLVIRNFSSEEKEALEEELKKEKYDIIHAENFYVMPHIPSTKIPILLTEQTILYRVFHHFVETLPWYLFFLKPILMIDVWKLKFWEVYFWKKADWLAAVSFEDKEFISQLSGRKDIEIIPNGVDFDYFSQKIYPKSDTPLLLFGAADFHWIQNKEGAEILLKNIWPKVKRRIGNAHLWIVGKIASQVLKEFLSEEGVTIEEIDDSRRAYQQSWILVAPMRSGGGSRTKFFEAMACGLPIVTTARGAEGIEVKNGQGIIIENEEKIARTVVNLILNPKQLKEIGMRGEKLVKERYDWAKSAQKLSDLYEKIGSQKT